MSLKKFQDDVVRPTWNMALTAEHRVTHAVFTIATEAAEVMDLFKKARYSPRHNGKLDRKHLAEEIGDLLYGVCALCSEMDIDPEECMAEVERKLRERYPAAFE